MSEKNTWSFIAPEIFRVCRTVKDSSGKEQYIVRAVTSDKCVHQTIKDVRIPYKIGKLWALVTSFSGTPYTFDTYLNKLIDEGWKLTYSPACEEQAPYRKEPSKASRKKKIALSFPLPPEKPKKDIYEAFQPENLRMEDVVEGKDEASQEAFKVREIVTPIIRHLSPRLENSIDKLELLERDEDLKKRIREKKEKRILTREQTRRLRDLDRLFALAQKKEPELFTNKSAPQNFTSKQDMLNYIKDRIKVKK